MRTVLLVLGLAACGGDGSGDIVIRATDLYHSSTGVAEHARPFAPDELEVYSTSDYSRLDVLYSQDLTEAFVEDQGGEPILVSMRRLGPSLSTGRRVVVSSSRSIDFGFPLVGKPPPDLDLYTTMRSFAASGLQPWGQYDTVSMLAPDNGAFISTWKGLPSGGTSFDSTYEDTEPPFEADTPVVVTQTAVPDGYVGNHLLMTVVRSYSGPAQMASEDDLGSYQLSTPEPNAEISFTADLDGLYDGDAGPRQVHYEVVGRPQGVPHHLSQEIDLVLLRVVDDEELPDRIEYADLGMKQQFFESWAWGQRELGGPEMMTYSSFFWQRRMTLSNANGGEIERTFSAPREIRINGEETDASSVLSGAEPLVLTWEPPTEGDVDGYHVIQFNAETFEHVALYMTRDTRLVVPTALNATGLMVFRIIAVRQNGWNLETRPHMGNNTFERVEAVRAARLQ